MDDLISRQAAIDALGMAIDVDDFRTATGLIHEATVSKVLDCIPSADVAPVVHGKWIVSHIPDSMLWECDQCGFDCGAHSFNFCPNCGAKMEVM